MQVKEPLYKVRFTNEKEIFEIYCRSVGQSDLFGFLEVEEIVFGESTAVVVDPSEERLKTEFDGVKRTYLPLHHVLRIDEVEKRGVAKIHEITTKRNNVTPFSTSPLLTPQPE